jgi:glycosyltransferase involved in cell wall biosynthesis
MRGPVGGRIRKKAGRRSIVNPVRIAAVKALHIFPTFGSELLYGAERHEYLLSRRLVDLGVEVDVLTTLTMNAHQTAAFSSNWPRDYSEPCQVIDGMRIARFPVSFSLQPRIARALSSSMLKRWTHEERRYGAMVKGSRNMVDYYYRRAVERPRRYDLMMALARGPYSIGLLTRLITTARNYDVILVGFTPFALNWQVMAAARMLHKPVVLLALFHPDDIYHHFRPIYWCLNKADAILAQTPYSLELFRRLFPASNPVAAGVGVDLAEFEKTSVCGARFRARHGVRADKIVLFVGRKEHLKRYDLAIEAVDRIADGRVGLVMIGRDVDKRAITSRHAMHLGELSREDVLDAYDACDVLVLPSESESFGWVTLEAWARRKPVIGNRLCGPVSTIIRDGEDGYLCAGAAEMAARIAELTSQPELVRKLGQAGYQKVINRYTWDIIAQRVRDVYVEVARGTRAAR